VERILCLIAPFESRGASGLLAGGFQAFGFFLAFEHGRWGVFRDGLGGVGMESEVEGGALANVAVAPDGTAMKLDNVLYNREAQAGVAAFS